jgi:hypothetical protein
VSVVSRLRRRAGDGEGGAVIVEFALVAMLLATLAFGTIEYSYGWRSSMSVLTAARGGARSVSSTGNDNQSDYFALTSIKANLDSAGLLEGAQRVVVYKADATNGDPPAACLVTPITATTEKCNIYTGDQLREPVQRRRLHDLGDGEELLPDLAGDRPGQRRLDRRLRAGEAEVAHRVLRRCRVPREP